MQDVSIKRKTGEWIFIKFFKIIKQIRWTFLEKWIRKFSKNFQSKFDKIVEGNFSRSLQKYSDNFMKILKKLIFTKKNIHTNTVNREPWTEPPPPQKRHARRKFEKYRKTNYTIRPSHFEAANQLLLMSSVTWIDFRYSAGTDTALVRERTFF